MVTKRSFVTGIIVVFSLVLAWLVLSLPNARADPPTIAPMDPGFNNGQPLPLSGAQIMFSSPTLADLDSDGKLDIVVGGSDGMLYAVKSNGTLLWSYQVANAINPYVAYPTSISVIRSAPSVGDLDGDGYPEVVVGVGTTCNATPDVNGGLVVLDHTGALLSGWPAVTYDQVGCDYDGYTDAIVASPALGDLDGDGDLEIVATSFDMRVYAWHHDGTPVRGWPQFMRETVWSPVGLADLDNDGTLEIVALIPTHYEPSFNTIDGGELQVYRGDGTLVCKYVVDQGFTSAPAIGDLDGDGNLEIVAGTGEWYQGTGRGWNVYVWDGSCNVRPGWPVSTNNYMRSAPALADLDGDGTLEIIATSGTIQWSSLDRRIYAWRHNGVPVPGFPTEPRDFFDTQSYPLSPIVVDWDGDASPEVFTSLAWEVAGVRADGTQFTYYDWPNGPPTNKTYWGRYQLSNDPAVGDIDGDGRLELVIASVFSEGDPSQGGIIVYEGASPGGETPWPMLGGNAQHTYLYTRKSTNDARIVAHTIPEVMIPGASFAIEITVMNTGTATWTAAAGYQLTAVGGTDPLAIQTAFPLEDGEQIAPGDSKVFSIQIQAPQTHGYYTTEWRMSKGGQGFGTEVQMKVKVGNDPALYVLSRDTSRSTDGTSVYPVGLAESVPAPSDAHTYYWSHVAAFGFLPDGSGYHVICQEGYTTWSAGVTVLGVLPYSPNLLWTSLSMLPDGTGFYAIDRNGQLYHTDGAEPLTLTGLPAGLVQDITATPDGKGILVIDTRGQAYRAGTAPSLPLPNGLPFPENEAIARRIKMTPEGDGYYILDAYGRLWTSGNASPLTPHYTFHIGEDWARDFELTEDGQGYYLLDKYGSIHTGGNAQSVTINSPLVWDSDQAVDLALIDDRVVSYPYLASSPTVSMIMAYDGELPSRSIAVRNAGGGGELNWEATLSPPVSWLAVSPISGTTPATVSLSVTAPLTIGTYSTSLTFDATDLAGKPVNAMNMQVTLYVWEKVHQIHLPFVIRNSH